MKKFTAIIVLVFLFNTEINGQEINNYKYVIVPEKFEFQDEPNEHQLNALSEFLFEKYGFQAIYEEEFPGNVEACEALTANLLNDSGFLTTRLVLTLEDCFGNIIFKSKEGKSKEKEYKIAYQEALRDAFLSVEDLDYVYEAPEREKIEEKAVVVMEIVTKEEEPEEIAVTEAPEKVEKADEEPSEGKKYQNANTVYVLKKTSSGFALFRYGDNEKFATLMRSGAGDNFLYSSEKLNGNAFFDSSGNLVVEYIDDTTGQLVSLKYLPADQ